jgi:hypothetical protein
MKTSLPWRIACTENGLVRQVCRALQPIGVAAFFLLLPHAALSEQVEKPAAVSMSRMQELGDEGKQLENSVGEWDVVFSFWSAPDAEPIVTKGLIAERRMVGLYQQEIIQPGPEAKIADFRRMAYLTFSRVEGRWQFVSLDTRFPVGLMPAYSFGKQKTGEPLRLIFEPIAFAGMGQEVEGHMMRSNLLITRKNADHEIFQQYFIASDGSEREWLAVQYEYTRRR